MAHSSPRFGLGITNCRTAASVVAAVRQAEGIGAEVAFIAEDVNCRDAFELATLCAAETRRIRLATGVVNPFTRAPASLAMAIATLDEISQGRAILGLGTSSPSVIQDQLGIPAHQPVRVMREAVEIVRALLNGGTVTYAGRHFTYSEARLALRSVQAHIPIYFAAMGPLTLRLAGRLADGVLLNVGASTEYVRWAVQQVRAGVAAAGRRPEDVTIAAWHSVYVGDGDASGLRRAREWLATVLSIPRQGELLLEGANLDTSILEDIRARVGAYPHRGDPAAAAEFVPPAVAERLTIIGTVPTVRQRLQEYRSAGVDLPILGPRALRAVFGG